MIKLHILDFYWYVLEYLFLLIYGVAVTLFVGINKLIKADNIYTFSKWFTILAIFIPIIFIGMGIFLICTQ